MATISISQLDTATQAKVDDLYEVAVVDENSQTGYASRNLTAAQIATLFAQGVQFSGLSTEAKTIIAAINEAAQNGGSDVEANPAGEPTDTLQKIGIDGTIYEVGGSEPVSKTVTGNPIHIEDAADAPFVSGEVSFAPKQDLHGYDKPWAGGAGKNKLQNTATTNTVDGVTYTVNSDGSVVASGTANGIAVLKICDKIPIDVLWGTVTLSGLEATTNLIWNNVILYDDSDTVVERIVTTGSGQNKNNKTFNLADYPTATKISVSIKRSSASVGVVSGTIYPQLEKGSTATDYEPYSNICPIEGYTDCDVEVTDDATTPTVTQTYTIDLDGTRYGGKVDLVTGEMTVDWVIVNITSLNRNSDTGYWANLGNAKPDNLGILCDKEKTAANTTSVGVFVNWTGAFRLNTSVAYSSAADCISAYGGSLQVCYELDNPFTVQLTPEQIRTLEGINNISTNMTGMSVEYITEDYQPLVKLIEQSVGHHYSEQERVVGTWFGKPLYEKSWDVSIEIPSASANTWLSTGILTASVNCDTVVDGKLVDNSNQFILGNIGFIQQNTYFAINVPIGNRTITAVTIQYTKTTD